LQAIELRELMALDFDFDIKVTDSPVEVDLTFDEVLGTGRPKRKPRTRSSFRASGSTSAVIGPDRSRKLK
jgi:hypothetical protein